MHNLLAVTLAAVACWLMCAPLVLDYPTAGRQRALVVDILIGSVLLQLAVLRLFVWNGTSWASRVGLSLGLLLMAVPVFLGYRLDPHLAHAGANEVLCGFTAAVLSGLSLRASGPWAY